MAAVIGAGVGWLVRHAEQTGQGGSAPPTVSVRRRRHKPPPKPRPAPIVSRDAAASFRALEASLPGSAGLAVTPLGSGPIRVFGRARVARAWSTSKVPVLVTLLRDYEEGRGALDSAERADATLALERSDNAAIDALFARLEQIHGGLVPASRAVQLMLRRSGDTATIVNTAPNDRGFTTEGQTEWSTSGEVLFYRALAAGCLLDGSDTRYVVRLMRSVVPSERWGIGSAGYPSTIRTAFKGGWGPGPSGRYQVRQSGIVGSGDHAYVLSLLALPANGSFSSGTAMVTTLARWAKAHVEPSAQAPPASCKRLSRSRG